MSRQDIILPEIDFPDSPESNLAQSPKGMEWGADEFDKWLRSDELADWAKQWIVSLRLKYGSQLPTMLFKGFGNTKVAPDWLRKGSADAIWLKGFIAKTDLAEEWFNNGFLQDDPRWLKTLIHYEKAKVARSFLLTGNISDYAFDPIEGFRHATSILVDALMREKSCVLTFRLSQGLSLYPNTKAIRDKLPKNIVQELDSGGFQHDTPLMSQICRLFNTLSQWLTGKSNDLSSEDFPKGVAIIFDNVHLIISSNPADIERNYIIDNLLRWSNSPELFKNQHCLILLAESLEDVANELRARGGKIEQIALSRPEDSRTRLKFLLPVLDPQSSMNEIRLSESTKGLSCLEGYTGTYFERIKQLSKDTAGLTLIGIEDLLQQALHGENRSLSRETVMQLKRERLRQESDGILEVIDPRRTLDDIGGYESIKERLRDVIRSLTAPNSELETYSIPMGILLLGPPGTGKSIFAESLAGESNISMAKLGDFRGMYVGQSERNLSRIFSLIESLHPVIIFIDEIDQALGKRGANSGDGGVDNRIFGRFLEFMSNTEHRGKILWVGASNFPDKIDPAMKRAGRFDLILPILLPDHASRKFIVQILLRKALSHTDRVENLLTDSDFGSIADLTDDFTGAELEAIVGEAVRRLVKDIQQKTIKVSLNTELFKAVLNSYKPPIERRKDYQAMELLAIKDVSFIDMLPDKYAQLREKSANSLAD